MSNLSRQMNCYILAGGKSSRMGRDKGLIQIKNKAIVEYVIEVAKPLFKKTCIISNNSAYANFGLECIPDQIKEIGPAGGILTAMMHSDAEKFMILSCDAPFITKEAVEFLIMASEGYEITVPVNRQKFEPLFALYSSNCLPVWKKEIEKGEYKLQNIISNFKSQNLPVEGNKLFTDRFFTNINTAEDLQRAINSL